MARKDLLAAQTEQQHARSIYDAALRKLRTYGVTKAQIRTILNGGLDKSVLTNLGLSPQAAVQKYLVLGKPSELFALEADYRQKQGEVESVKRQLQILGFSAASVATVLQRGVPDPILTLTAPISGAISARQATPGAMVDATEKLLEFINMSLAWSKATSWSISSPPCVSGRKRGCAWQRILRWCLPASCAPSDVQWTPTNAPCISGSKCPTHRANCSPRCLPP